MRSARFTRRNGATKTNGEDCGKPKRAACGVNAVRRASRSDARDRIERIREPGCVRSGSCIRSSPATPANRSPPRVSATPFLRVKTVTSVISARSRQTGRDLRVAPVPGEPRFLPHGVLELIEAEIGQTDIDREIGGNRDNQQWNETPKRARSATFHHCDWAPSMMSLTIRSMACLRPSACQRSSYWPSARSPLRCHSVLPVTWSTISMSTTS